MDRAVDLDTRHLRAFAAVCAEGTFTDAAIALGTTQASVSRSVQRVEATVGARVLERSARGVALTAAGERVLAVAHRVLASVDALAEAAAGRAVLRLGYAWAALGRHTVAVQRGWRAADGELVLVHANTASGGLLEGRSDVAVVRTGLTHPRLAGATVGTERRWAALAADDPLAGRPVVGLGELVGRTVAADAVSGTTGPGLWPPGADLRFVPVPGVEEWLTLVASGRAVGVTAEATTVQHARAGVAYVPLADAAPVDVRLLWWREEPPPALPALLAAARAAYAGAVSP